MAQNIPNDSAKGMSKNYQDISSRLNTVRGHSNTPVALTSTSKLNSKTMAAEIKETSKKMKKHRSPKIDNKLLEVINKDDMMGLPAPRYSFDESFSLGGDTSRSKRGQAIT
jgi:hypothetical protein